MSPKRIGVMVRGNQANEALDLIEHAAQLGIHAAWMTTGFPGLLGMTVSDTLPPDRPHSPRRP